MGRPGRKAVADLLPDFCAKESIDCVLANAENAAGGRGLTPPVAQELFKAGIHVLTLGNHTWDRSEIEPLLSDPRILRPANYPALLGGQGMGRYPVKGTDLVVIALMGRHNLAEIDSPFQVADKLLAGLPDGPARPVILVDMHAEATSEKQAMGWYLDGRVTAVLGTHTHVQTADERILPQGTAYLSDVGMTGPLNSIIGGDRDAALKRFLTGVPVRIDVAEGDTQFNACVLEIDDKTRRVTAIRRIYQTGSPTHDPTA